MAPIVIVTPSSFDGLLNVPQRSASDPVHPLPSLRGRRAVLGELVPSGTNLRHPYAQSYGRRFGRVAGHRRLGVVAGYMPACAFPSDPCGEGRQASLERRLCLALALAWLLGCRGWRWRLGGSHAQAGQPLLLLRRQLGPGARLFLPGGLLAEVVALEAHAGCDVGQGAVLAVLAIRSLREAGLVEVALPRGCVRSVSASVGGHGS